MLAYILWNTEQLVPVSKTPTHAKQEGERTLSSTVIHPGLFIAPILEYGMLNTSNQFLQVDVSTSRTSLGTAWTVDAEEYSNGISKGPKSSIAVACCGE